MSRSEKSANHKSRIKQTTTHGGCGREILAAARHSLICHKPWLHTSKKSASSADIFADHRKALASHFRQGATMALGILCVKIKHAFSGSLLSCQTDLKQYSAPTTSNDATNNYIVSHLQQLFISLILTKR